jgi:two-component system LytT family response regulator
MKVIIVEDEISCQQYLEQILLDNFVDIEIVDIIDNVPDSIKRLEELKPDLVFLDVEIKMGSGFDILASIKERSFEVIFTTAFNTFAVDAFRYSAVDYLLKPLQVNLVIEAVNKVKNRILNTHSPDLIDQLLLRLQSSSPQKNRLIIYTTEGMEFVEIPTIMFAEAKGNYTDIWLSNGTKITASKKLKEIEESLPAQSFFRVHHSYIVNLNFIKKYHKGRSGHLFLLNGKDIPVAESRKDDFLERLR